MNVASSSTPDANPFSTRFVRPGAIHYLFEHDDSLPALVERFFALGGRAQIVGPHGSGKSTLLAELVTSCAQTEIRPLMFSLHDGQRWLPAGWRGQVASGSANLVILDGYEQLGIWSRWQIGRYCRRKHLRLLVTAHRDVGFPNLIETSPTLDLAERIVQQLVPADDARLDCQTLARHFAAAGGNLREMLFSLYDRHERRRPS